MEAYDFSVQALGKIEVYNEDNDPVLLSTLWADKTAVLFFVRHFGWVFSRQQVAEIAQNSSGFTDKNIKLAVIGSDETQYFKEFRKITGYSGLLLSDPSRQTYSTLGFSSGIGSLLSLQGFSKALSALKEGIKPGAVHGSALQLGGVVIVEPSEHVQYYYASKKAGDHPALADIFAAVQADKKEE